jgi:hypothetical protein
MILTILKNIYALYIFRSVNIFFEYVKKGISFILSHFFFFSKIGISVKKLTNVSFERWQFFSLEQVTSGIEKFRFFCSFNMCKFPKRTKYPQKGIKNEEFYPEFKNGNES